jgi:hypothetical protein
VCSPIGNRAWFHDSSWQKYRNTVKNMAKESLFWASLVLGVKVLELALCSRILESIIFIWQRFSHQTKLAKKKFTMGGCGSKQDSDNSTKDIDNSLSEDRRNDSRVMKILLLGSLWSFRNGLCGRLVG